jgi:hypothetical protein
VLFRPSWLTLTAEVGNWNREFNFFSVGAGALRVSVRGGEGVFQPGASRGPSRRNGHGAESHDQKTGEVVQHEENDAPLLHFLLQWLLDPHRDLVVSSLMSGLRHR